jgi:non-ribosomal peptide synthase protein (TIGR01720 family)
MYKTGDLVQHAGDDGSFRYIGRKDTQAKLRGQRLEMADIEHHLRDLFPRSTDVVAEILRPQDILVAFICTDEPLSTSCARGGHGIFFPPSDQFRIECFAAQKELASALPAFMIPSLFLPVSRMPVTTSGKTNRRELQKCAALLPWEDLQSYRGSLSQSRRSSSSREEILQRIWAQSLNRSPEEMEVTESFFRLGGDSVSAMQVAATCKSAGFMVTVRDIFRYPSIEELAGKMETSSNSTYLSALADEDPIDTWFGLSPIQQLFVQHTPEGHDKFTQQFLLKVSKHQPESRIHQSIRDIVDRHSMLRASFRRLPNGQWEQAIRPKGTDSYCFRAHSLPSIGIQELRDILSGSQRTLDIKQGTLLAIDLVTTPHQQLLSIMAHHMVIDLVSWRVILQDLDELLLTGTVSGLKSLSFQTWCLLQHEYSREVLDPRKSLPGEIPPPAQSYWGGEDLLGHNMWGEALHEEIRLPENITSSILGVCNDAFRTQPVELIHTALVYAFSQTFKDRPTPTIFSEGHGREPWDPQIDVSRTVGWFTTLAPIFVNAKKDQGIADLLQRLKESRRSVTSNGWGYFTSRYLHEDGPRHFQNHGQMEIIFNYTGRFQQLEGSQALLKLATLPDHDLIPVPPDLPRFALIDVSATVMDECLHISFWYNRRMKHQEKLHQWILGFQKALESLPIILRRHQRFTMSDFPLLSVTTDDQLQSLVSHIAGKCRFSPSEIEEIYPCSPVQTGMWLSQIKNPDMYWSSMEWSLHPTYAPIDLNKVRDAWQRVVDRYTILRTTFATGPGDQNYPVQVVLQSIVADVKTIFSDGSIHANCEPLTQKNGRKQPSHWLILRPQPGGEVVCELNIHHMLIDGYTRRLLISDFQKIYDGQLKTDPGVQYRSFISYCQEQDGKASQEYWNRYLEDVKPCIFPSLVSVVDQRSTLLSVPLNVDYSDRIQSVCNGLGITVFNLLQVAWGLVLRAYTGSDCVCFAYLTAGREIPLQGAQCIAGPLINLLVCRLSLSDEDGVESALRNNQSSYASSLDNQICTLVDVIHALNLSGQALFNTAMSLQKTSTNWDQNCSSGSRLEYRGGHDVTEVCSKLGRPVHILSFN